MKSHDGKSRILFVVIALALQACSARGPDDGAAPPVHEPPDASSAGDAPSIDDAGGLPILDHRTGATPPGREASAPLPTPAPPQVTTLGGPVLAPHFVPITYAGDPEGPDIDAFTAAIGRSAYWTQVTQEYGVGAAASTRPVHLAAPAPALIDDTQIRELLVEGVGSLLPAPAPGLVYAFFFPASTTVSWNGALSCGHDEGYHWDLSLGDGTLVSYAVIPRCDHPVGATQFAGISATTLVASHEYIEAATDPFPTLAPAYEGLDAPHAIWGVMLDDEVSDLCTWVQGVAVTPPDLGYVVQRSWSNRAIAAGHDPCLPAPEGAPFFAAVPVLNDEVHFVAYGQVSQTTGLRLAVGESRTIDVVLHSDRPTDGSWTLTAADAPYYGVPATTHDLSFKFEPPRAREGDRVKLTITAHAYDPRFAAAPFVIDAAVGGRHHTWFGIAGR